jgi:hypothetical protein
MRHQASGVSLSGIKVRDQILMRAQTGNPACNLAGGNMLL